MKISPARTAAFDALFAIETERVFTSDALPKYEYGLTVIDSALCHEIVLGVLRRQIYLDKVTASFTNNKTLDSAVRIAIRMGLYQILVLDKVPDHAAINESVMLVQRAKKMSAKGFVNAILRRATRETVALIYEDDLDRISVETSHPRWLIERWGNELGFAKAETIASANNNVPASAFRSLNENAEIGKWHKSKHVEGAFLTDRISPELREREATGEIYFQDEASQLVARAVTIPADGVFLDVCASPGGKTGLIASRYTNEVKFTVAGDISTRRVEFLRDNCIRQGVSWVNIVQYDAEARLPFAESVFDTVFVDAPCSGTGTIRHNPEIRYFLEPSDFARFADKQLRMLMEASKLVKSGGSLVYSTCSLEREENEIVIERFLADHLSFSVVRPDVPDRFVTAGAFARTWPHRDGMDGFFIAGLKKA
ncbi:MAG: 16S rRNA (cytosine(967)-C(5))-methyltransferase RsmB [Chloracidobacterium sp.]|nr:16S rRNA (cytosine(967)-C(5))-methyltransferase RsmB [Chloracidobacterium sp.]